MSSYREFAKLYDDLMNDVDYEKWFKYIKKILMKHNCTPKNVLEMACGTGNITEYLCDEVNSVTCFDLSEEMLSVAYDKLRKFKNVKILNQNMIDFHLNGKYDLILCACDSINYILNYKDLQKVFVNVYNHLNHGGLFIFDINSYYKLSNIIGNNTFVEDREDIFYVWENYFDYELSLCEFYLTFFVENEGAYTRFDENHTQRAYKLEEITLALEKANFSDIKAYDGFTFNNAIPESERINFVALKAEK